MCRRGKTADRKRADDTVRAGLLAPEVHTVRAGLLAPEVHTVRVGLQVQEVHTVRAELLAPEETPEPIDMAVQVRRADTQGAGCRICRRSCSEE